MKVNAWVSDLKNLPQLASATTEEQQMNLLSLIPQHINMSGHGGYTLVGTADISLNLSNAGAIESAAVRAIDTMIDKVNAEFALRIKELQEARASLLSLPATVTVEQ